MKLKTSTVTQKGQIVIPSRLRRKLGIRQGTQIAFIEEDERLVLQPLTAEYKANFALPYADCFVASLAHRVRGEIVTSDSDFSIVKSEIPITFL